MKFLRRLTFLAALAVLPACEREGRPEVTLAEEVAVAPAETPGILSETSAQSPDEKEEFAFLRTSVLEDAASPTLCLHFTAPLDPSVSYEPYVRIVEKVAVRPEGERLCIEGLRYGQTARLTLRAGLPAADGESLPADEQLSLSFSDRPAVVRFAGDGFILPRSDARGLGILTVNVDEVDVTVSRVDDRALVFKNLAAGFNAQEGRWAYQDEESEPGRLGITVFEGTLETEGAINQAVTTLFPFQDAVGPLAPGAYYVSVADASAEERAVRLPARAGRWLLVTDLAITAYTSRTGINLTVRSLNDGAPVRGAEISLVARSNEILETRRTSSNGRVRFGEAIIRGEGGNAPKMALVEGPGGDFTAFDLDGRRLDLSHLPVGGKDAAGPVEAFLYLDCGIYRPGETLRLSALLRDAEGYSVKDRAGTLSIFRPNGTKFLTERFEDAGADGALIKDIDLPKAAARGMWSAAVSIDALGEVGRIRFNVEDFVPQRLSLDLEADDQSPLAAGEERMVTADVRFLYGAPGAGLEVDGSVRIESDPSPFPDHSGFSFGIPDEPYRQEVVRIEPVVTDGEGIATFPVSAGGEGENADEPLRLRTVIRVEEPGGRAVQDDLRIPYRPRDLYVGIRSAFEGTAERGVPPRFEIAALGRAGEGRKVELSYAFVRRDYAYDWYQDERGQWRWRRSERIVPIADGVIETGADGRASIEGPALSWGDYELSVSHDGDKRSAVTFWVGYGGRTADGTPAPDQVEVMVPDAPVPLGETARVAVRAPYAGRAEIVVANHEVLSITDAEIPEGGAELSVPVTDDWGAGAYVLVSVYSPREPGVRPVPRRAVGAAYLPVDTGPRRLPLTIEAAELERPGEEAEVTLRLDGEKPQGPIFATIAAVDEGILQLTKFETPDPFGAIFGKRGLGLVMRDDYGRILDPETGVMGQLRTGGDQIGGAGLTVVPTRTVALYRGPVEFGRDGRVSVSFELPSFNGSLRLMAVGWSDSAVGSADRELIVREKVPAELVLPRFLAPGDEALATLTIDNVEGAAGTYSARVEAIGGILETASDGLRMKLAEGERSDLPLGLSAERAGIAQVQMTAEGPDGFTTERSYPIEIRPASLPVTRTMTMTLAPGETYRPGSELLDGFVPGTATVTITASPTPLDLELYAASLSDYPYQCSEQLVSKATPLLLKADRSDEETAEVMRAVETLLERQGSDGAFGLWRVGDRQASPWIGAYITDFLSMAKAAALPVSDAAMERAYRALQPVSQGNYRQAYGYDTNVRWLRQEWRDAIERNAMAYALYVLTEGGVVDRSRLRYVHDQLLDEVQGSLARAQLGAALALIGDEGRAQSAFEASGEVLGRTNPGDYYQSDGRELGGVLAHWVTYGRDEEAEKLLGELARELPGPERLNTLDKAFLARAIHAYSKGRAAALLSHDGSKADMLVLEEEAALEKEITNPGTEPIYLTVMRRGVPDRPVEAGGRGLSVRKTLFTTGGDPVDLGRVRQGDRLIVALDLAPERERPAQYAVTDLLPAGFEIEAVLTPSDASTTGPYRFLGRVDRADIAEARDDRFVAALDMRDTEERRFAYVVRAVTPGDFAFPGAVAEDMYRPSVTATSAASRVVIAP
jgi:uncharacterized protein YfaS (alpha-2-macroglobulin family)